MKAYDFDGGHISVSYSDEDLSIGTLTLYPNSRLDMHSRPVEEQLLQVQGKGGLIIDSDKKENQKVTIDEGETYNIPANRQHSHFNPTDETSTVIWKFEGDITGIISDIRSDMEEL